MPRSLRMAMKKRTLLLDDLPVDEDDFGSHARIAEELFSVVHSDDSGGHCPHSIALLGDWGSGKSSVVRMLKKRLTAADDEEVLFVYDAWAHEGDGLRRAFLDALKGALSDKLTNSQSSDIERKIWDKQETIRTTTQQILRRHGKIFLSSLLLAPIGLSLFDSYPDNWDQSFRTGWNFLCLLLSASPIIAAALFFISKRFESLGHLVFDTEDASELRELKLTTIFFQQVDGTVEHRSTTNPSDSIRQFREALALIVASALGDPSKRLVIVVDNIDRLGRDEARSFWATMQSFFDRNGWSNDPVMKNVWLIVPFSPQAVGQFFASADGKVETRTEARSFVDKSFDISFHVPTPIQVDARSYLLRQLNRAFPDHPPEILEAVRNLYDHHRTGEDIPGRAGATSATRRTPREMKLFINQLVALYRIQGDETALVSMAAYLLIKDSIDDEGFALVDQLSTYQRSLMPLEPEPVQQLAAVHFGVSLTDAAQVVLSAPIAKAVEEADHKALERLSKRSGFVDVLEKVLPAVVTRSAADVLTKVNTLDRIGLADSPHLHTSWTLLLRELMQVNALGDVDEQLAAAVARLAQRLYERERHELWQEVEHGLSGGWISDDLIDRQGENEEPEAYEDRMSRAGGWVRIASHLVGANPSTVGILPLPSAQNFVLRAIDALSTLDGARQLAKHLEVSITLGTDAGEFASWPGLGYGPVDPVRFCQTLSYISDLEVDWTGVLPLYASQLTSDFPEWLDGPIQMLVSVARVLSVPEAAKTFKQQIESGQLGITYPKLSEKSLRTRGFVLAGALLLAPDALNSVTKMARPTDKALAALLDGSGASDEIVAAAATIVCNLSSGTALLGQIAERPPLQPVAKRLVIKLIEMKCEFVPSLNGLVVASGFLHSLGWRDIDLFFDQLSNLDSLVSSLGEDGVSDKNAYVAYFLFRTEVGRKSIKLRNRLVKYIGTRDSAAFANGIRSENSLLMAIAGELSASGRHAVGVSGLDALLQLVSSAHQEQDAAVLAERIQHLAGYLEDDLQSNLTSRIWGVLLGLGSAAKLDAAIALVGPLVTTGEGVDAHAAINNVFVPLLEAPTALSVSWITSLFQATPELAKARDAIGELRARANALVRPASDLDKALKTELRRLVRVMPKPQRRRRAKKRSTKT